VEIGVTRHPVKPVACVSEPGTRIRVVLQRGRILAIQGEPQGSEQLAVTDTIQIEHHKSQARSTNFYELLYQPCLPRQTLRVQFFQITNA